MEQNLHYCKSTNFGGYKIWRFSKYSDLAAIKFGVSPSMQCTINVRSRMLARQILAKTRNSPNSPNTIARQNLLIYSTQFSKHTLRLFCLHNTKCTTSITQHLCNFNCTIYCTELPTQKKPTSVLDEPYFSNFTTISVITSKMQEHASAT